METKTKKESTRPKGGFDSVRFMREQRRLLSEKLSKMTKEEIVAYFKKKNTKRAIKPCA